MMWQAILVDDEEFVRAELAALFPWERYQFKLVGEAEDAQTAMKLIKSFEPDLIITDIRMPEIDGLTLISWIRHHYPELVVVVVSAFNDFPLVREALRLGAADYLIKAEATRETAGTLLEQIRIKLQHRYAILYEQEELAGNMVRYHQLAMESFWRDVLTRASDQKEIDNRTNELSINLKSNWFGLIYIHVSNNGDKPGETQSVSRAQIEAEIQLYLEIDWLWKIIDFQRGDFVVITSHSPEKPNSTAFEKLQRVASKLASKNITTSTSVKLCKFEELAGQFREVREVNLLRLYFQDDRYFQTSDLFKFQLQSGSFRLSEVISTWERLIRSVEPVAIRNFIHDLFNRLIPENLKPETAINLVIDLMGVLRRICLEHQIRWDEFTSRESDLPEILIQAESLHDWQTLIEEWVKFYLQATQANNHSQVSLSIRKALLYIQSNFTRDLSLAEVADHAGVSKSYLSRVFPEYAGEHFSDYLQHLRIERAKELLRFTDDHIYEIASKVGFWNSRYFSKVFHEMIGMSPADYRRILPVEEKD